ncbi:MAG TPA: serine hydrolase domain-containing protein [Steroidobacteraceae bacterium]|jgi:CubicO group peptidase (beta-lactamase class C family)|nr:serine hydrolase domain-containing protein [Steroidobacteraceae bacterium]
MRDPPSRASLSAARLQHLGTTISADIEAGHYHGAVILVAHRGQVALHEAVGYANRATGTPIRKDHVFSIFSVTKAFTNALVFRCIERGDFALTTRIAELVPEFSGGARETITVKDLLTHCSGLPSIFVPVPGMYIDRLEEVVAAICAHVHAEAAPGGAVSYAPMAAHALLGEAVRRCDRLARSFRAIAHEDLFAPLGMRDTAIGVRADLRARHIVPEFLPTGPAMQHLGHSNLGENGAFEEEAAEMPWVGAVSTVADLYRFAEMLRRGGELDSARILAPAILDLATRNWTGEKPNELYVQLVSRKGWPPYPAYIGLGFFMRGEAICPHQFGTLASPRTFGNTGYGSAIFWVDPAREMTFVCLTAGVMDEADNIERFQRLSDIALAAVC